MKAIMRFLTSLIFLIVEPLMACEVNSLERKIIHENSTVNALNDLVECEKRDELDAELYWMLFNLHSAKNGQSERYSLVELDKNMDYLCKSVKKGYWFGIHELIKVMRMNIPDSNIENNYAVVNCLDNLLLNDDFITMSLSEPQNYIVDPEQVNYCLNIDTRQLAFNECL